MYSARDWQWLRMITTRLERAVPKKGRRPIFITSQRLFDASLVRLDVVDAAFMIEGLSASRARQQCLALRYRDALLVAVATFLPLRRSNLALLEIGATIRRGKDVWTISIAGEQVKNGEPIIAGLEGDLCLRIDRYVNVYRPLICRSHLHKGFWASAKGCPARGDALYNAFQKETRASVGHHLTLHDTRRIGATTWAVYDPVNAAGAKALLGDRSDRIFTNHYNLANGIEASRKMSDVIAGLRGGPAA